jgi:hypothetical protein
MALIVIALPLLLALALLLSVRQQGTPGPRQWLAVSPPVFVSRMTSTGAASMVSLIISNAGPRTVDPSLSWYECRAKTGLVRTRIGSWRRFASLAPGRAAKVGWDLPQGLSIGEPPLFCCEITWYERGSFVRRRAEALSNDPDFGYRGWNINWMRPWQSRPLTNGVAFASNVAVADYFRSVYGMDEAYFERTLRQTNASSPPKRYGLKPLSLPTTFCSSI